MRLYDVHLSFDPRGIAGLHGIDLELHSGEVLAVLGPNGAGKTTLLRVLAGTLAPASGKVESQGPVVWLDTTAPLPLQLTTTEWLCSQTRLEHTSEQLIQMTRDLADMLEFIGHLKLPLGQLSQGLLQRVRLAGALMDSPQVLLMDEPFSSMDTPGRADMLELLRHYLRQREVSVVWVTHHPEDALNFADRIALMQHGKFEQIGSPQEMFFAPKSPFAARFWGHPNLCTITRPERSAPWVTPFGAWKSSNDLPKNQVVMLLPPHALKACADGPFQASIRRRQFHGHHSLLWLQCFDAEWAMTWHGPLPQTQNLRFSVDLAQALLIDCL